MPDTANQIGVVTISHGTATAEGTDGVRPLAMDSPVFAEDVINTGDAGSAVEIKFNDGALLSQGPNSSIILDTYVYDPVQSTGEMTVKLLEGTFRSVTGEIVDMNPEGFQLETPLATIGIRGTTTGHTVGTNGQEAHVVVDFVDKPVVVRPTSGGPIRVVTADGQAVSASSAGLSPIVRATPSQMATFEQLSSQSLQQGAPSFDPDAAEKEAEDAAEKAAEAEAEAEEAAEEAAEAEAEAEVAEAEAEAAAQAAAEAAAAEAAAQAAAEAAAQVAAEAAAQAAVDAAAAEQAAAAQAAAEAAAAEAAAAQVAAAEAAAVQAAAEAAAQVAAAEAAAAAQAAEAAAAQSAQAAAAAEVAAANAAAQASVSAPAPTTSGPEASGAGDEADGDNTAGDDGGDDAGGTEGDGEAEGTEGDGEISGGEGESVLGGTEDDGLEQVLTGTEGEAPSGTGGDGSSGGTPPPSDPEDSGGDDPDLDDDPEPIITSTFADLSNEKADLTVDLAGGWFEHTGDSSTRESLPSTVSDVRGAMPFQEPLGDMITPSNDITGNDEDNVLEGGAGDNTLNGGAGNDYFAVGLVSNDVYIAGDVDTYDMVIGGTGIDTFEFHSTNSKDALNGVQGIENIRLQADSVVDIQLSNNALVDQDATLVVGGTHVVADLYFDATADTDSNFALLGGIGNDSLVGSDQSLGGTGDTLFGGIGDDTLEGLGGNDSLFGGGGVIDVAETHGTGQPDLQVVLGGGADSLVGGAGDDYIDMGDQFDVTDHVDGGADADTLYYVDTGGGTDELSVVSNVETVEFGNAVTSVTLTNAIGTGTLTFDASSLSSSSKLTLDTSAVTASDYSVTGGAAGDDIITSDQHDSISGGYGDDTISSGAGNDYIDGGAGKDSLVGGAGDDTFVFQANDVVSGEVIDGSDISIDTIEVDGTVDFTGATISSIDWIRVNDGKSATFSEDNVVSTWRLIGASGGSAEKFIVDVDSSVGSSVDLSSLTFDASWDAANKIKIDGNTGADNLVGSDNSDSIQGDAGQDTLIGGTGNDTIDGGTDADKITGGAGDDSIDGGSGDDTIYVADGDADTVDGCSGTDRFEVTGDADLSGMSFTSIEEINVASPANTVTVAASEVNGQSMSLLGAGAAMIKAPGEQTDLDLSGLNRDSHGGDLSVNMSTFGDSLEMDTRMSNSVHIVGGAGDDTLSYTDDGVLANADELNVVSSIENLVFGNALTSVMLAGNLTAANGQVNLDTTALTGGNTFKFLAGGTTNKFNLIAGDVGHEISGGNLADTLTGGAGADTFNASSGDDLLTGNGGADTLFGDMGADTLMGGQDNDTLSGGADGDVIDGGSGADEMDGGDGTDTLTYASAQSGVMIDMQTGSGIVGDASGDTASNFEVVHGSAHGDTLAGNNSTIIDLYGMDGDDLLRYNGLAARLDGGAGDDTIELSFNLPASGVVFDGGAGSADMVHIATNGSNLKDNEVTGIEIFKIEAGLTMSINSSRATGKTWDIQGGDSAGAESVIIGSSGAGGVDIDFSGYTFSTWNTAEGDSVSITGGAGDDTVTGTISNDFIDGIQGNDTIYGLAGDDTLLGAQGDDLLTGGTGADAFKYSYDVQVIDQNYQDTITDFVSGTDTILLAGDFGSRDYDWYEITSGSEYNGIVIGSTNANWGLIWDSVNNKLWVDQDTTAADDAGEGTFALFTGGGLTATDIDVDGGTVANLTDPMNWSGTSGDDTHTGGLGDDTLSGLGGNDSLVGGYGDDSLYGKEGNDTLHGGEGNDYLLGGTWPAGDGHDSLYGEGGNDTIKGYKYNDYIEGGDGDDLIYGEGSSGVSGNDTIKGGAGDDTIYGDGGVASDGDDLIEGGAGADVMDGGAGTDTLSYAGSSAGVHLDFENVALMGGDAAGDTATNFEVVYGSDHQDTITGSSADDSFEGGAGADTLTGGAGYNTLHGGAGDDVITGGIDDDRIRGGDGADTLDGGASDWDWIVFDNFSTGINFSFGNATVIGGDGQTDSYSNFEGVVGTTGDDTLTGDSSNNMFAGIGGDDLIDGGAGTKDWVYYTHATSDVHVDLSVGRATLDGFGGDDTLTGIERIGGSAHDDTLIGDTNKNDFEGRLGDDSIDGGVGGGDKVRYTHASGSVTVNLETGLTSGADGNDTLSGIEHIVASDYGDSLTGLSTEWSNMVGNKGHDTMTGFLTAMTVVSYWDDPTGVTVDLDAGTATDGWGDTDTLINISGVQGSNYGDSLTGNANGNFFDGHEGDDTIDGAGGVDTISFFDATSGVDANLTTGVVEDGQGTTDTVSNIEAVDGSIYDDTITGSDDLNILAGGDGNDSILGMGDNDLIDGGIGNDTIYGGTGWDTIQGYDGNDYIYGGEGTDSIDGGDGDDTIKGGSEGDFIRGGLGDDNIDGGDNDLMAREYDVASYLTATTGVFVDMVGGTAIGWDGSDTVTGGDGSDTLLNLEGIQGSIHADKLVGDNGELNVFIDGGGADIIDGGTAYDSGTELGFDVVSYEFNLAGINANLANGAGTVITSTGIDTLTNIDVIIGTDFNDTITGGLGRQEFQGGTGNDTIDGGADTDKASYWDLTSGLSITWDSGNGRYNAVSVADSFTDQLINIEQIEGSQGDDTITLGDAGYKVSGWKGNDLITGGAGDDTAAYFNNLDKIDANLGTQRVTDGWGDVDTLTGVENILGSNFDDTLIGDANGNILGGDLGADTIFGGAGDDTLWGDDGDDTLRGGAGDDELVGDTGADVFQYTVADMLGGSSGDMLVAFSPGEDKIQLVGLGDDVLWYEVDNYAGDPIAGGASGHALVWDGVTKKLWYDDDVTSLSNPNTKVVLVSGDGDIAMEDIDNVDGLVLDPLATGENWVGTASPENHTGTSSDDTLHGKGGNDTLMGLDGADTLMGGADDDSIIGGLGDDEIMAYGDVGTVNGIRVEYIDGGAGQDNLTDTASVNFVASTIANIESVYVPDGEMFTFITDQVDGQNWTVEAEDYDSTFKIVGTSEDEDVDLTAFDNMIVSGSGEFAVYLNDGNDIYHGTFGEESIYGGAGNDYLSGADGADELTGGAGADSFAYESTADVLTDVHSGDSINDFETGSDMIVLSGDFNTDVVWYELSGYSGTETGALDAGGPILVWDSNDSNLWYDTQPESGSGNDATQNIIASISGGFSFGDVYLLDHIVTDDASGKKVISGGVGNDNMTGSASDDTLYGHTSDDTITGGTGNERIMGGAGNDVLQGVDGNDTLVGGEGADVFLYQYGNAINSASVGDEILDFEQGTDMILFTGDLADSGIEWYEEDNYDGIIGAAANDQPVLVWDSTNHRLWYDDKPQDALANWQGSIQFDSNTNIFAMGNVFVEGQTLTDPGTGYTVQTGTAAGETLTGTASRDTLFGSGGDDSLVGGDEDDLLIGGEGVDSYDGGAGSADTISFSYDKAGVSINMNTGAIVDGWGNNETYDPGNIEYVVGSGYDDTVFGDSGSNFIRGGGGADEIVGSTGADTFFFKSVSECGDTINDFTHGSDKLLFEWNMGNSFQGAEANGGGALDSSAFATITDFSDYAKFVTDGIAASTDHRFIYVNIAGGDHALYYDENGDGADGQTMVVDFNTTSDVGLDDTDIIFTDFPVI